MAAVSKAFETHGESKEITLGKKIAELKKRLVLAGKFIYKIIGHSIQVVEIREYQILRQVNVIKRSLICFRGSKEGDIRRMGRKGEKVPGHYNRFKKGNKRANRTIDKPYKCVRWEIHGRVM